MTGLVLLTGAGAGIGLWLVLVGLFPRPPRLSRALDALDAPPLVDPATPDGAVGWAARTGRSAASWLRRAGLPTAGTRRDLAAIGKPVDVHLAEQVTAAVVCLLLPAAATTAFTVAGIHLGFAVPAAAGLVLGGFGFFAPELSMRGDAAKHRAAFRHALGSFLDLVVVALAGGAGVDQSLDDAAAVGKGRAYVELRYVLAEARVARVPPWDTLAGLGRRVGVGELEELAASVGLAGTEGARVRSSLRSRAAALRTRQLTDAEAEASAATERMSLPIVVLFTGFLVFIGFPALAAVFGGL
jgi:Flp pilus assembly protein TadB